MLSPDINQLVSVSSKAENTPELQNYWEKRYSELFLNEYFAISQKTLQAATSEELVTFPLTPYGDIKLLNHLDDNNNLDEVSLQNTIETVVRFLDSLVSTIPFNTTTQEFVTQYRKIGVGLADFEEYMNIKKSNITEEVDYIGNFLSSTAYRASESLAEEKGAMLSWNKIKKHLRPKTYEFWYNTLDGEIKDGLEISESYDQDTIIDSDYELIPRRNSHILLYSNDQIWDIWNDRDQTAPITENNPSYEYRPNTSQKEQNQNNIKPNMPSKKNKKQKQKQKSALSPEQEVFNKVSQIKNLPGANFDKIESAKIPMNLNDDAVVSIQEHLNSLEDQVAKTQNQLTNYQNHKPINLNKDTDTIVAENQEKAKEIITPLNDNQGELIEETKKEAKEAVFEPISLNEEKTKDKAEILDTSPKSTKSIELKPTPEIPEPVKEAQTEINLDLDNDIKAGFQIGELVQISDTNHSDHAKVYQVIEVKIKNGEYVYKLTGGHKGVNDKDWKETQIQPVELLSILDKINSIDTVTQKPTTPAISIDENIQDRVRILVVEDDKVLVDPETDGSINLPGGSIAINKPAEMSLKEILVNKYGLFTSIEEKFNYYYTPGNSEDKKGILNVVYVGNFADTDKLTGDLMWMNINEVLEKDFGYISDAIQDYLIVTSDEEDQDIQNGPVELQTLQELVKTSTFGNVPVTLGYGSRGPNDIQLKLPENIDLADVNIFLGLINQALKTTKDLDEFIEKIESLSKSTKSDYLSKFLHLIALSLKYAPKS